MLLTRSIGVAGATRPVAAEGAGAVRWSTLVDDSAGLRQKGGAALASQATSANATSEASARSACCTPATSPDDRSRPRAPLRSRKPPLAPRPAPTYPATTSPLPAASRRNEISNAPLSTASPGCPLPSVTAIPFALHDYRASDGCVSCYASLRGARFGLAPATPAQWCDSRERPALGGGKANPPRQWRALIAPRHYALKVG